MLPIHSNETEGNEENEETTVDDPIARRVSIEMLHVGVESIALPWDLFVDDPNDLPVFDVHPAVDTETRVIHAQRTTRR